jgi:hypothetical protein
VEAIPHKLNLKMEALEARTRELEAEKAALEARQVALEAPPPPTDTPAHKLARALARPQHQQIGLFCR